MFMTLTTTVRRIPVALLLLLTICYFLPTVVVGFSFQVPFVKRGPDKTLESLTHHGTCIVRQPHSPTFTFPRLEFTRLQASTSKAAEDAVKDDIQQPDEGIQRLFDKYAQDGLLDKATLETIPPFAELLVRAITFWVNIFIPTAAKED